jgi:hypothetical protein
VAVANASSRYVQDEPQSNVSFDSNIPQSSENATEIRENYANAESTLAEIDEEWKRNKPEIQ